MPSTQGSDKLKSIFSSNLKNYMKKKDMNTADLARALSYSFTTVSDWVNGKKYPRMDKVQEIADYFGILKSDLTEEHTETPYEIVSDPVYKAIQAIMDERGLSITDVAHLCNLSDSTVHSIMRRERGTIALSVAFKIADGLGISLEKLNGMPEKPCPALSIKKSPLYSSEAMQLAADYDGLDKHGQKIIRLVADEEKARCTAVRSTPDPELHWLAEELEKIQLTLNYKGEPDDIISLIMKCVQGLTLDQQRMFLAQLQALIEGQIEAPPSSVQQ